MAVNLKPEQAADTMPKELLVEFEDQQRYLIELRHGIADIRQVEQSDTAQDKNNKQRLEELACRPKEFTWSFGYG